MANAAATLVGQNLGAGKPDRAETSVWHACFYNLLFLSAVGIVFVVFPAPLVAAFGSDPQVTAIRGHRPPDCQPRISRSTPTRWC